MTLNDYASLLTPRKRAVARYVAQGFSDKQIAAILGRSEDTIAYHVAGIARIWRLDSSRNIRVQIAQRILLACDLKTA
jgi:DNA-binding NarL/FixJ family response regulator